MRAAFTLLAALAACASRAPTPVVAPLPPPTVTDAGVADVPPADAALAVTQVPLEGVTRLALSGESACALAGGRVRCWRGGDEVWAPAGRLTDNSVPDPLPAAPGITDATDLCVRSNLLCALRSDGTLRCRARVSPDFEAGEEFEGTVVEGAPAALRDVASLEGSALGCVAVTRDGRRQAVLPPTRPDGAWGVSPTEPADPRCALEDGAPRCVGSNAGGLLANSTVTAFTAAAPSALFGLTGVRAVAFGPRHACAALRDGSARCWGRNLESQLGTGDLRSRALPTAVPGLDGVASLSLGRAHTCALREAGDVRCWGLNTAGALGDGSRATRRTPGTEVTLTDVAELVTHDAYACARRRDGSVWCWGGSYDAAADARPAQVFVAP